MQSTFTNVSERPVRVFIPFVSADISKSFITKLFADRLLGKINSIQLHDKKLVKHNSIKSAKHFYAFIEVTPFTTETGVNFRRNVEYNNTTHVMYQQNNRSYSLEVKPHLTIEERVERGFNIIPSKSIPDYKPAKQQNTTCENRNPIGMFNNDREREDILNDYNSIEKDMNIERESFQEWCMWTSPTFI
jgi:hypothetical protein